jgi:hypothetical protein
VGEFDLEIEELVDGGDGVVTGVRIAGRGRGSGIDVEMHVFNVWMLRDGTCLFRIGARRGCRLEPLVSAAPSSGPGPAGPNARKTARCPARCPIAGSSA